MGLSKIYRQEQVPAQGLLFWQEEVAEAAALEHTIMKQRGKAIGGRVSFVLRRPRSGIQ